MEEHVCPIWVGYLLASPLRKLFQSPKKILGPYVRGHMTVLDIGCAMGFFSLPLAEMVGSDGKVICIDVQEKMIASLQKRAREDGLSDNIETRVCSAGSLGLEDLKGQIDVCIAFAVVHEVPDVAHFFIEINTVLRPGGRLLMAEPKGHVSQEDFELTLSTAKRAGFTEIDRPRIRLSRAVLLIK